jgi:shikimate dehydrogenase
MKHFGLLGEKLSHSFSPLIHSHLADYEYLLYEKAPAEVETFLLHGVFDGLNVTIPYKKTVIPFCDELSDIAKKIGSVNTLIRRPDGSLFGDNTDYYGFLYLLRKAGADVRGKKAVILGSGGSSVTVKALLEDQGAGEIITVSRSGENNYDNISKHADAYILINTTPVGMYPNNGVSPVCLSIFKNCAAVLDIIYNPARTKLLLDAEELGIVCTNGLPMLVAQAKRACELFLGTTINDEKTDDIATIISRKMANILLIGMPGSGKSSVGAELAELTDRAFFDTDTLIAEKAGKSIPEIFGEDGEAVFRNMETDALAEVTKKSGCVIATGGGIVKKPENLRLMRQNGIPVFLDRELSALPVSGRPLSQQQGVEALAKERIPLYEQWSEYKVPAQPGVTETAEYIKELLEL